MIVGCWLTIDCADLIWFDLIWLLPLDKIEFNVSMCVCVRVCEWNRPKQSPLGDQLRNSRVIINLRRRLHPLGPQSPCNAFPVWRWDAVMRAINKCTVTLVVVYGISFSLHSWSFHPYRSPEPRKCVLLLGLYATCTVVVKNNFNW